MISGLMGAHVLIDGVGEAAQTNTPRWQDYRTAALDPDDDCTVWYIGEYFKKGAARPSTRR